MGIDVGNAKLKLCRVHADGSGLRWETRPLPYDDRQRYRRHRDFEEGLADGLASFLSGAEGEIVRVVVAVMSSGYSYPSYREGVVHTMATLARLLPSADCRALSADGSAIPASQIATGDGGITGPIAFSNGLGAVQLTRRLPFFHERWSGLVVDTGGSTTATTPILLGCIDPSALRHGGGAHLEHRISHGKLAWIGVQTTPLETLAEDVLIRGLRLPVIPRGVGFDVVATILGLLPAERARRLSLFGAVPDRAQSLRALADSVNLDPELVTEDALVGLARHFHDRAVDRLARHLQRALATVPDASRAAVVYGLGARCLAEPALRVAGLAEEAIVLASKLIPDALAEVASCYGACHLALEILSGRSWPARIAPDA